MTRSKVWFLRGRPSHAFDPPRAATELALPADPPLGRDTLAHERVVANSSVKAETRLRPSGSPPRASGSLGGGTIDLWGPTTFTSRLARSQLPPRSAPSLREIFTPTRPKADSHLFFGRGKQLRRIISGVEDQHAHIVIHGERGSGKTSLANVIADKAEAAGYLVLRFVCSAETSFDEIFSSFLHRMTTGLEMCGIPASRVTEIQQPPPPSCGLQELLQIFGNLAPQHLILIIDEYDRVTGETTKARLAELIKNLSDAGAPVTLLIIGIAENVTELLGKHPSLQRTLMTVPLPLMTRDEIAGIIAAGEEKSGLKFDNDVRQSIINLAQGLPYHAQLLCYFAARSAVWRHSNLVEHKDLHYAVQRALDEAHSDIKLAYDLAVRSNGKTLFRDALFLAARCPTDEFGTFTAMDAAAGELNGGMPEISLLLLQRAFKKLTEPHRGAVLQHIPSSGGVRYRFASHMLRHHVLCRVAQERGILQSVRRGG
jgi:Cdc6-like AAA superfamily ATPase